LEAGGTFTVRNFVSPRESFYLPHLSHQNGAFFSRRITTGGEEGDATGPAGTETPACT